MVKLARWMTRSPLMRFIGVASLLLMQPVRAAEVDPKIVISTPTPQVYVGDQIIIDVEATAVEDEIDFAVLWRSLTLQRKTNGTRIAVINGKVVEIKIWRFEATASTPGEIVMGPLRVGDIVSNAVRTDVQAAPDIRWEPTEDDIKFSVSWSKPELYVQEQLILTIKLDHRYPIAKLEIKEPTLDGFRVIPLIKDRRTERDDRLGREFTYLKRYALFAGASGEIPIPAFEASGHIIKSRLERAAFNLRSTPQTIRVRAAPAEHQGAWWLPALDVRAYDEWSKDKRWLAAGEQVERSAIIEASGVSAEQLPDIVMPEVKGLRIAFIDSERETQVHDNGVSASARFNFSVRALSPIPVFPDPIAVHWWNTREDKAQTAFIRTGRIDIGAPSREALLALVEEDRSPMDWLSRHKSGLWLATLLMALLALVLQWRLHRGLVGRRFAQAYRWFNDRRADSALIRASGKDDSSFMRALHQWTRSTGFKPDLQSATELYEFYESRYALKQKVKPMAPSELKNIARALIQARNSAARFE